MTDLTNIPAELRDRPQWVAWRRVPSRARPGKTEKIPVNPHTGCNADSTDPATWGTFAQAQAAAQRYGLAGVGLVLTQDDGLVCVDLDNAIDADGNLTPEARRVVDAVGSYTEVSQSGHGLHIIAGGTLPPAGRVNHAAGVEMYADARFVAMTGNVLPGCAELEHRPDELTALHAEVFTKPQPPRQPAREARQPVTLADTELVNKLRACQSGKYGALFDGHTAGYRSQSEADLALCHGLAFYAGGDANTVDRLFRDSGLYRDKWDARHYSDGATYGERTIAKALEGMTDFYDGNGREPAALAVARDLIEPDWPDFTPTDPPALADDDLAAHLAATASAPRPAAQASITGSTWADMARATAPITYDWPGWLAPGFLHELVADSGAGKSAVALGVCGVYLLGWPWPDGTPFSGATGCVLWCEAEAAQALNLERAQRWGLPLEHILSPMADPLDDVNIYAAEHRAAIDALAQRADVRLVVVDSLSGATGGRGKGEDLMPVVKWLAELARDTHKPVLLLHHLRKRGALDTGTTITLDRVRDSSVVIQPARIVWAVDAPDPNQADNRRLSVIKSNLGRFPSAIGLRIDETGIRFGAAPQAPRTETQLAKAKDLLRALLADGPMASTDLEDEGKGAGISWDTMKRAKDELGIVAKRDGKAQKWTWALPARSWEQEEDGQEADD